MNPVACIPWKRAYDHAKAAFREDRGIHTIAMLLFTSLPVVAAYAYALSATWLLASSLTALFFITLGDCNPELIATYFFDVPKEVAKEGFRRSVVTKADGSCFFDAVRLVRNADEKDVRRDIARWIEENRTSTLDVSVGEETEAMDLAAIYAGQAQGRESTYCELLRQGNLNVWGDVLEIIAVHKCYDVTVRVYEQDKVTRKLQLRQRHIGAEGEIDLLFTPSAVNGEPNHYRLLKRSFLDDWMRF